MAGLRILIACVLVATCQGYPSFREKLPNGYNVPHPCIDGAIWNGVGHENKGGGGVRNVFGMDFKRNGMVWNEQLCNLDSDGDGKPNGEELGDPDCEWTPGSNPKYTSGLSHPGVCEPFSSSQCDGKPSFVDCRDTSKEKCKVIDEPETFNFTGRFPETVVPAKETSYMCVTFELPVDQEYHLVAYDPVITNIEMMHHTLVFGCEGVTEAPGPLMQPFKCGDEMDKCRSIMAVWSAGGGGSCYDEQMGVLVGGASGFRYAVMQHHWNNPGFKSGHVDSSGMVFHLTPKLRPNNAGVLMIGQYNLEIPPGTLGYSAIGSCHGDCTEQIMDGPIYISTVFNHMHLLGRGQYTERLRDGKSTPLAMDRVYDYNTPITHTHGSPVMMLPGDELKTTCMFKSTTRNVTTNFGDATFDEMCLAFLTYYPKENLRTGECVAWKSLSHCEINYQTKRRGCDFDKLSDYSNPDTARMYQSVGALCSPGKCRQECLKYVRDLKKQPCFSGDVGSLYRVFALEYSSGELRMQTIEWFSRLDSCDSVLAVEKYKQQIDETSTGAIFRPTQILMTSLVLCFLCL